MPENIEQKKLYCPLCFAQSQEMSMKCEAEGCAWWDVLMGQCAILSIAIIGAKGSHQVVREEMGK
jgi:hypothetical protein